MIAVVVSGHLDAAASVVARPRTVRSPGRLGNAGTGYGAIMATTLMVWIDQDLCTGDGICSEICPDVFVARDDGLWVVKEEAEHFGSTIVFDGTQAPDSGRGVARVPDSLIDLTVEAAEECPGECIMIEPYDQSAIDNRGA